MDSIKYAYAASILKAERDENGDLIVYGKATGPDLDLDKQVCDPAWLKTAMPTWMASGGNVREQHSSIAAGVATDLEAEGDSWMVRSLVVDPVSAVKVEKGVLKGYSIGIKNPRVVKDAAAPGGRIVGGEIVEVSLVDRPCNPTCTLTVAKAATPGMEVNAGDFDEATGLVRVEELSEAPDEQAAKAVTADDTTGQETKAAGPDSTAAGEPVEKPAASDSEQQPQAASAAKTADTVAIQVTDAKDLDERIERAIEAALTKRAFTTEQREQAADNGQAMSDGSFPIKNVSDLKNAIKAVGRAKDPAAAKRHIIQRAKALGRQDLLPDTWKSTDPDLIKADGDWTHDPAELAAIRDGLINVIKAELDEFTTGDDERCDLSQLLCALSMYLDWWQHEATTGETSSPFGPQDDTASADTSMVQVDLAATADTTKSAPQTPALNEERVNQLITAAVTKATEASGERVKALEAELAKVKSQPIPGGPVLTRTAADTNRAALKDEHLAKAARFRSMADQVTDQQARAGYLQMAAEAEAKAAETSAVS